jgi:hypothetical protein
VGVYCPCHETGRALAAAGLADRAPLRPGRRRLAGGPPVPASRGLHPGHHGRGRRRLRRHDLRDERGRAAHQREPCGAAGRRHAGAGGADRGRSTAHGRAAGRLGGVCGVAGRSGAGGRIRRPGRRHDDRGWPGSGVAGAVGGVHGGADPAAAWPRPGGGHGGAVPRRHRCHAAADGPDRAGAAPGRCGSGPAGDDRAGTGRHAGAVHPVRLRAVAGVGRGGGAVPEPGAADRHGHRGSRVRRPVRAGPDRGSGSDRGRDRGQQPAGDQRGRGGIRAGRRR